MKNTDEKAANHDLARRSLELMRELAVPSQELMGYLVTPPSELDTKKAEELLKKAIHTFLQLEKNHQMLIEKAVTFQKGEKKRLVQRLGEMSS